MIRWLYLFGILLISSFSYVKADKPIYVIQVPLSARSVVLDPKNIYNKKEDQEKIILAVNQLNLGDSSLEVINKIGLSPSYYAKAYRKPLNCVFGKYFMVYQFNKIENTNGSNSMHSYVKEIDLSFSRDERLTNILPHNIQQISKRGYGCQGALSGGV